jgi:hypothetical protein
MRRHLGIWGVIGVMFPRLWSLTLASVHQRERVKGDCDKSSPVFLWTSMESNLLVGGPKTTMMSKSNQPSAAPQTAQTGAHSLINQTNNSPKVLHHTSFVLHIVNHHNTTLLSTIRTPNLIQLHNFKYETHATAGVATRSYD